MCIENSSLSCFPVLEHLGGFKSVSVINGPAVNNHVTYTLTQLRIIFRVPSLKWDYRIKGKLHMQLYYNAFLLYFAFSPAMTPIILPMCTCYVLGALLETRNTVVSKRDKVLDLMFKL